jgi:phage terminase large subunit-like protein
MCGEKLIRHLLFCLLLLAVPMSTAYTATQYIREVESGAQVACKWVKLAVKRHVDDLKRAEEDPDFPYYFDEDHAKRVIDFKQQLRHTQGPWANPRLHDTRLHLEPWQQFKDWVLFGWRRAEDGYRRFSKAYIEVARKNGKTVDGAATANYCFIADSPEEMGPEVYCVATKKEQASKAWAEAERQLRKQPYLKGLIKTYAQTSTIVVPGTAARFKPLGKDSGTEDGLNPHFVLVDEYHAHRDNSMLEVMESGTGARPQSLTYIITTAGIDKESACYREEHVLAERVLERSIQPVPESFFCIIYTLDEEDDWTDSQVWIKSNPNLGVSVGWERLEERILEAKQTPTKQNQIKTKNLNIWTQAETRWITDEEWSLGNIAVNPVALKNRKCYGGLDLSTSQDITAWVLCFPPESDTERYKFLYRFFIPEENIIDRERRDRVPYQYWIEQGYVYSTPGNVIDYDFIEQQIEKDSGIYALQEIGYDPWNATEISNHLEAVTTMVPIFQRYGSMAWPTRVFDERARGGRIAHGGNPVIRWMVSCTEVKSDRQSNIMPMKPRHGAYGKRIDGTVASIMALGRAVLAKEGDGKSVYEDRGIVAV